MVQMPFIEPVKNKRRSATWIFAWTCISFGPEFHLFYPSFSHACRAGPSGFQSKPPGFALRFFRTHIEFYLWCNIREMSNKEIIRLISNPPGFGTVADVLEADMFASELPVQHSHEFYQDDELGLYVGVWDTDDMVEAAGPYEMDEFMWLLEGKAGVKNNKTGEMQEAKAGEAFLIPKAYDCQWRQTGYLRKYFMIFEPPGAAEPDGPMIEGIVVLPAPSELVRMTRGQAFLMKGDVVQKAHESYVNASENFHVGTWECEAFESVSRPFPHYQMSCVQEGSLSLIDSQGEEHIFEAGDVFFVPEGTECSARAPGRVRLFYAVLQSS